jgi:hypothetical protein
MIVFLFVLICFIFLWRRICLDNPYLPIMHLQKLADTQLEQQSVNILQRQANMLVQYLLE